MLYRPNFCCNCGEKIERVEWNLLTSRRFCAVCSSENSRHDLFPRLAITSGALALMFGIGTLWTNSGQAELKPLESSAGIKQASAPATLVQPVNAVGETRPEQQLKPNNGTPDSAGTGTGTVETERAEGKFFCGALTKKGTPCSRKVKGKGLRCFQHEGRPEAARSE